MLCPCELPTLGPNAKPAGPILPPYQRTAMRTLRSSLTKASWSAARLEAGVTVGDPGEGRRPLVARDLRAPESGCCLDARRDVLASVDPDDLHGACEGFGKGKLFSQAPFNEVAHGAEREGAVRQNVSGLQRDGR